MEPRQPKARLILPPGRFCLSVVSEAGLGILEDGVERLAERVGSQGVLWENRDEGGVMVK